MVSEAERRVEAVRKTGIDTVAALVETETNESARLEESHLHLALTVYIKVLGARHRDVGYTLSDVGLACLRNGKILEVIKTLEEAVDIRHEALSDEHPDTLESQAALNKARKRQDEN